MGDKILFVDDDQNLLDSYRRQLRKTFEISTANGGNEGLECLARQSPFAVVVSDMRMPRMDGVTFLTEVKTNWPDTIRVMLTGNADLQTSIDAVNEGAIFRFLTKPCPPDLMKRTLYACVDQYRLQKAEKELFEQTLGGCVKILAEILSLVNPFAFGRATRIRNYVRHMVHKLRPNNPWKFHLAAMLSQVGCVTMPPDVLNKIYNRKELTLAENKLFSNHPMVACELLRKVPRLEDVALMVEGQLEPYPGPEATAALNPYEQEIALGAQILRVCLDFDRYIARAISPEGALAGLRRKSEHYNPELLKALEDYQVQQVDYEVQEMTVQDLQIGMVAEEHIRSKNGTMLVPAGHEVSYTVLERLQNFSSGGMGIQEPFRVRVPIGEACLLYTDVMA